MNKHGELRNALAIDKRQELKITCAPALDYTKTTYDLEELRDAYILNYKKITEAKSTIKTNQTLKRIVSNIKNLRKYII